MTRGAEDGPTWQKHIGKKRQRRKVANEFNDAKNPFKVVIVRDMRLPGFDAHCLHTICGGKPMQGYRRGFECASHNWAKPHQFRRNVLARCSARKDGSGCIPSEGIFSGRPS